MSRNTTIKYAFDWPTVLMYVVLVVFGWISIYGASYEFDQSSILDWDNRAGKQFVWIITAFGIGGMLLLIDYRMYNYFAYIIYGGAILLLLFTLVAPESISPNIKGSRSWLVFGPVSFQPAELAKMATALAISKFMSAYNYKLKTLKDLFIVALFVLLPFAIIVLQKETGTALVFTAFLFVFYREGMNGIILLLTLLAIILFVVVIRFGIEPIVPEMNYGTWGMVVAMFIVIAIQLYYAFFDYRHFKFGLILLGAMAATTLVVLIMSIWWIIDLDIVAMIFTLVAACYWAAIALFQNYKKYWLVAAITVGAVAFSFSADYLFDNVLESHQQIRIKVLLNMEEDLAGAGYNVNQSKIAIGSGGFWGKGLLNGTQTKLKYVPEQDTDFIFCTVGEEHGFWGSTLVLVIFWLFLMRLLHIAERQREAFHRIYAYSVVSIVFFHLLINIGMVLGIMPVIGIPLPFFSYGGSSLWSFTILLFILLRMDASRLERV